MNISSKTFLISGVVLALGSLAVVSHFLQDTNYVNFGQSETETKPEIIRLSESDLRRDDVTVFFEEQSDTENLQSSAWSQQLPDMFRGTDVVGSLSTDEHGDLIVDADVRQLFDYFLTAQDDASIEQIRQWIGQYIGQHLKAPADQQAYQLLEGYIEYKTQLNALEFDQDIWARLYDPAQLVSQSDLKNLRRVFQEREQLQQSLFDQHSTESMFGKDNQYDRYMLERMVIATGDLPAAEKQRQLSDLNALLPQESLEARQSSQMALHHKTLSSDVVEMSDHEKYQVYVENYGEAAAERLVELDQKRAVFKVKRAQYLAYKQSLDMESGGDALLNIYMVEQLSLSAGEMKRMKNLDQVEAQTQKDPS